MGLNVGYERVAYGSNSVQRFDGDEFGVRVFIVWPVR